MPTGAWEDHVVQVQGVARFCVGVGVSGAMCHGVFVLGQPLWDDVG